jgi:glycine dehydrogenase
MAGFTPVAVECDDDGDIDIDDLQKKIDSYPGRIAAFMVTYPSTHGVFEANILEMCQKVHDAGGQVYMDGANLNAQIGLCKPAKIGADVSHMNLHKTFCIPHGGGGPGVGPIGVRSHLTPLLPGHVYSDGKKDAAVSAAPWGSAGILPISWMYIAMMGKKGLREASYKAILSANYISWRLDKAFKTLYHGHGGHVAHECIIDIRPFEKSAGVAAEDIAKRLIDYGFHAPTMSFPVAGTLMIEPTESESLEEIDRFCDALLSIREEIRDIETGKADAQDNLLKNAPHTSDDIVGEWPHPYSRAQAVFPVDALRQNKYWAPVSRVDNVYGDRNLFCVCPPVEGFLKAAE